MKSGIQFIGVYSAIFVPIIFGLRAQDFHIMAWLTVAALFVTILATVLIWSDHSRPKLKKMLSTNKYRPHYERSMRWSVVWLQRRLLLEATTANDHHFRRYARSTFTYFLLDRALFLAVAYPIFLLVGQWFLGSQVTLGGEEVLPAEERFWVRVVAFCLIANILASPLYVKWASNNPQRFVRSVAEYLPAVAFALAVAAALAIEGALAFAGAIAVALALAVAAAFAIEGAVALALAVAAALAIEGSVAFAGAIAFAIAAAFTIAFPVAFVSLMRKLLRNRKLGTAAFVLIAAPSLTICGALVGLNWQALELATSLRTIMLFIAVLPLLNGLVDAISYGITLVTAQMGLARRLFHPLIWALIDLAAALCLFLLLGIAIVAALSGMNAVTGVTFVDLGSLLASIGDFKTYWWLYAMAFSTVLPTAVHFGVACLSLQSFAGAPIRDRLIKAIEQRDDIWFALLAPLGLASLWIVSLGIGIAVLGGFIWMMWNFGLGFYLDQYRLVLIDVAIALGGI